MMRTHICQLARLLKVKVDLTSSGLHRLCLKNEAGNTGFKMCQRDFHVTIAVQADDIKKSRRQPKPWSRKQSKGIDVDSDLHSAASEAAKSLPGDWQGNLDQLMARLSHHADSTQTESTARDEAASAATTQRYDKQTSLLDSMQVEGKPKMIKVKAQDESKSRKSMLGDMLVDRQPVADTSKGPSGRKVARRQERIKDIFEVQRLGIFDADKIKEYGGHQQTVLGKGLWEDRDSEVCHLAQGGLPRNAFEEQIEWTKQGKMWTFPIDNEADLHMERQYKFHEHIFLERHLSGEFPKTGPIRKFMELVCLGLSKSPWLTVPEKIEHIKWFGDYFREKQSVLESSLEGNDALMPDRIENR